MRTFVGVWACRGGRFEVLAGDAITPAEVVAETTTKEAAIAVAHLFASTEKLRCLSLPQHGDLDP